MITKLYKIIILSIHEFTLSVAKAVQILSIIRFSMSFYLKITVPKLESSSVTNVLKLNSKN